MTWKFHYEPHDDLSCTPTLQRPNMSECFYTHTHTHTFSCSKLFFFKHIISLSQPPHQLWGPHLVPHLEQAAVKWGPVWELLAGLVETAKAWSSLAPMTLASPSSLGSMLGCCRCYCQEADRGEVKHNPLWGQGPRQRQFT